MRYKNLLLELTDTAITDAIGTISLGDLPDPQPENPLRLTNASPIIKRLWRIALADIEANIVEFEKQRYFGAGKHFGLIVYTRDISYSGLLGLNRIYPELMLNSLKISREVRLKQGFKVSKDSAIKDINAPWKEEPITEKEYVGKYHTNSYTRRTDDVVWLWAARDLLEHNSTLNEWEWLYKTGNRCFEYLYAPFYDEKTRLYCGQASFIDIHFVDHKTSGYPQSWNISDCVLSKSLSTNCLYVQGLQTMAVAASQLGLQYEADEWSLKSERLKQAIRDNLSNNDGTFTYLMDCHGKLQLRRDALGSALLVLTDVVSSEKFINVLGNYPVTDAGVPLFHPFFQENNYYHNNSSWPFVDTFFIKALEKSDGKDRTAMNAALLARTCIDDGTFHEFVDFRNKQVKGSSCQLWTAAAFIDTCLRAGLRMKK
jgi:Mannosylglycerate hydrolase MGH1-like glycoside hydrolase domain